MLGLGQLSSVPGPSQDDSMAQRVHADSSPVHMGTGAYLLVEGLVLHA